MNHERMRKSATDRPTAKLKSVGENKPNLKQEIQTKLCRASAENRESHLAYVMSSPRKVTDVSFHQHRETVPNNNSC
jgi:hypothetical protein